MENSKNKYSIAPAIMQAVIEQGPDFMLELFRLMMKQAMKAERESHLNASSYERTPERSGYANGFKPKTLNLRAGRVTLDVPQVRDASFYPQSLEKGLRSERALTIAMAEMYVQGVSTRKVKSILEKLCGLEVSSTQVSEAAKSMDEEIRLFRERTLGRYPIVYVDAEYQRIRINGSVTDVAMLENGIDGVQGYAVSKPMRTVPNAIKEMTLLVSMINYVEPEDETYTVETADGTAT